MSYSSIIDKVSEELNLPKEVVDRTYKSYWLFIKQHIQSLPLNEDISEQEFKQLDTSINIPSIGKLHVQWDKLLGRKRRLNIIKQCSKKRKSNDKDKED